MDGFLSWVHARRCTWQIAYYLSVKIAHNPGSSDDQKRKEGMNSFVLDIKRFLVYVIHTLTHHINQIFYYSLISCVNKA